MDKARSGKPAGRAVRGEAPLPNLTVLYEDNHCVAIVKAPGLLTTGYDGTEETLDRAVKAHLKAKYQKPGNVFLGVVHRLDRVTSGVLLYARTSKAAARLAEQFREGTIEKKYWAIVRGFVQPPAGVIEDWLWKDRDVGRVQVVASRHPGARRAELEYEVRGQGGDRTWLELRPRTGRTHQIRVQLAAKGYPIVGDVKYGGPAWTGAGIALHAHALTFQHPVRPEQIKLTAPIPPDWARFQALGVETSP